MHFNDLDTYRYNLSVELADVVTVGWLAPAHEFPVGSIGTDALRALMHLALSARTNKMRGYHGCELCRRHEPIEMDTGREVILLGSAECWVPASSGRLVFAAPDLLYHYVTAHQYRPPQQFIDAAVTALDRYDWNPDFEYQIRVKAAYAARK
jgi:hypothetical protein